MIIKIGTTVEELRDMLDDEYDEAVVTDIGLHGKHVVDLVFGEPDEDEDEEDEDEEDEEE